MLNKESVCDKINIFTNSVNKKNIQTCEVRLSNSDMRLCAELFLAFDHCKYWEVIFCVTGFDFKKR